jgi:hypothetical protein
VLQAGSLLVTLPAGEYHLCVEAQSPANATSTYSMGYQAISSITRANGCDETLPPQCLPSLESVGSGAASAGVRCCSSTEPVVCTAVCPWAPVSYAEAEAECASLGLELCSTSEVLDGACCGAGCGADDTYTWTRDDCVSGHQPATLVVSATPQVPPPPSAPPTPPLPSPPPPTPPPPSSRG